MKKLIAIAMLLNSGCASLFYSNSDIPCYVPKESPEAINSDAISMDSNQCSAKSLNRSQHMACMRLKGYAVAMCDAHGNVKPKLGLEL